MAFWTDRLIKLKEEKKMGNYSYSKTIKKGLRVFVLFLLPILVDKFIIAYPELAQLTIGGILVMGVNYLKHRMKITLGGLL